MEEFNSISNELTQIISKADKKSNGIFFTPKTYRQTLLCQVNRYIEQQENIKVLEPSFGSGEFILDVVHSCSNAQVTGVEINDTMYNTFRNSLQSCGLDSSNIILHNMDFLQFTTQDKFDLIIGNPPYVVVKTKSVPSEFKTITSGRPNLYCWFLYKCVGLLKDNGVLGFVIPNSILNTAYYDLLRRYIHKECDILDIIHFKDRKFMETDQDTIGLILRKTKESLRSTRYIVDYNRLLFSVHYEFLKEKLSKGKNLQELGFNVKTGSIVWNQVKNDLTDDASQGTLLIYSSNFKNGRFEELKHSKEKKQYIKSTKPKDKGPVILMHRGYGNGPYNMNCLLIKDNVNGEVEFYAENHVNVIYPITEEAKETIELVYNYLLSDENKEYIMKFTGNGAMSKTEIETILPVSLGNM